MLEDLQYGQKVFIEITNLAHGGLGWELGTCLWSPMFDKGGGKSWKIFEKVKENDIVIHLVKIKKEYMWYGISNVSITQRRLDIGPPQASTWSGMSPYQRIDLKNFNKLEVPYSVAKIFEDYHSKLRELQDTTNNNFFVQYGINKELRIAQKYLALCSESLYEIFDEISQQIKFHPYKAISTILPSVNEPYSNEFVAPPRKETIISRIVRDTKLSRIVKLENNWCCQVCGEKIFLPNENFYAEGHHLQPLGGEAGGPDIRENIIVLCPTHHAEFDYGSIAINPKSFIIEHIHEYHLFQGKEIAYHRNDLGVKFLEYHYNKRFGKL